MISKRQNKSKSILAIEIIENKIFLIRDKKVMIDRDLAQLYGVKTEQLTMQVRRNIDRFPDNFLIHLTKEEFSNLICQFGRSSWGGTRKPPLAFTEHGILMLSSVLSSKKAIQVNIQIIETFMKLREMLESHKDLKQKIGQLEKKYEYQFKVVFDAINKLLEPPKRSKGKIGFYPNNKKGTKQC